MEGHDNASSHCCIGIIYDISSSVIAVGPFYYPVRWAVATEEIAWGLIPSASPTTLGGSVVSLVDTGTTSGSAGQIYLMYKGSFSSQLLEDNIRIVLQL